MKVFKNPFSLSFYLFCTALQQCKSATTTAPGESPTCEANPSLCAGSVRRSSASLSGESTVNGIRAASASSCELYMAESLVRPGQWGIFVGAPVSQGRAVGQPEPVIPMVDAKMNEWSPWNAVVEPPTPRLRLESRFLTSTFTPGIQQIVACSNRHHNIATVSHESVRDAASDALGLLLGRDAGAGSSASYLSTVVATQDLWAGEELVVPCDALSRFSPTGDESGDYPSGHDARRRVASVEYLASSDTSFCLDQLLVGPSSLPGAGRGALAKRDVPVGQVIIQTPVLHLDTSQMEIVDQSLYDDDEEDESDKGESASVHLPLRRDHGIKYTDRVKSYQLMLNYAYSSPESHVLLVPLGPGVNFINHHFDRSRVNAYLRWSSRHSSRQMTHLRPMEVLSRSSSLTYHDRQERASEEFGDYEEIADAADSNTLLLEIVAARNIVHGEEIFIDYGAGWEEAWNEHLVRWEQRRNEPLSADSKSSYQSAREWMTSHDVRKDYRWKTEAEQVKEPYPENLQTACFVSLHRFFEELQDEGLEHGTAMDWSRKDEANHMSCLRPCSITHRIDIDGTVSYRAIVYPMERFEEPEECGGEYLPSEGLTVEEIASEAVTLIDKPYSSDIHQPWAFRHSIVVPENFLPSSWRHGDPNPSGDFIPTPLAPGQLDHFYWKDTGDVVLQNAYRLGLSSSVRETLLTYCDKMGITELMRHVTVEDNGLRPGEETNLTLHGYNWFIQRPEKKWFSNLHWLSPADNRAHENYLQTLSLSGFDDMLEGIGEHLGLDSLVVFHVTFIAVSQSTRGYVHTDVSDTGARTFNVIVPLMKATNGPPELDIQENMDNGRIGRYAYEKDVAALMGDESWHGTSAVDYRIEKEMRLAATIYIAEVTNDNVLSIMSDYTQAYPPRDHKLLLSWAGRHWKRDDPERKLPKPNDDHVLHQQTTSA